MDDVACCGACARRDWISGGFQRGDPPFGFARFLEISNCGQILGIPGCAPEWLDPLSCPRTSSEPQPQSCTSIRVTFPSGLTTTSTPLRELRHACQE